MGNLEDHYRKKAAATARKLPPFHEAYNTLVALWNEVSRLMLQGWHANPPQNCEWISVDGQSFVCWELWRDYEYTDFLYFLSDGRVIGTRENKSAPRVVEIRQVSRSATPDELRRHGRTNIGRLLAVCEGALSSGGNLNRAVWDHPQRLKWQEMLRMMYFDIREYERSCR